MIVPLKNEEPKHLWTLPELLYALWHSFSSIRWWYTQKTNHFLAQHQNKSLYIFFYLKKKWLSKIVASQKNPKIVYYTCDQSDVSYPKLGSSVPFYAVAIYGVLSPLIAIVLVELSNAKLFPGQNIRGEMIESRRRRFAICVFHAISLFLFGMGVVLLLTEIGKRWIGKIIWILIYCILGFWW